MPTYEVYIVQTVSTCLYVEADSPEDAASDFYNAEDMPGGITHQAFGTGATVDEAGEWEAESIMLDGEVVWPKEES